MPPTARGASRLAAGRGTRRRGPAARRAARRVRPLDRPGGGQADQDGPGRGRARRRHVPVRGRRGPHAHRRDDPARRLGRAMGKLGFMLRVPIGVVGAISPFNFPLNLVAHKVAPGDRGRLSGRAEAGVGHAAHRADARRAAARRVRAARRVGSTSSPAAGRGRQPPGRAPRRRDDHVHRLAPTSAGASGPRAPQEGGPRARQQRPRHHRARRRLEEPPPTKIAVGGLLLRRPVVHLGAARLRALVDRSSSSSRRLATEVEALVVGDPIDDSDRRVAR